MVVRKNSFDAKGLVRTLVRTVAPTLVRTDFVQPCAHHCAHHIFCMCTGRKVCTSYTLVRTLVRTFVRTMAWQNLVRTMPFAHVQGLVLQTDFRHKVCTSRGFLQMTI